MVSAGGMAIHDVPPGQDTPVVGSVVEFDDPRGLGTVEAGDGRRFGFHCTAITDGTRTIEVGRLVVFTIAPGRLGRFEAANVRPLPGVPAPGSSIGAAPAAGRELADAEVAEEGHAPRAPLARGTPPRDQAAGSPSTDAPDGPRAPAPAPATAPAPAVVDMEHIPPPPPDPVAVPSIDPLTVTPPRGTPEVRNEPENGASARSEEAAADVERDLSPDDVPGPSPAFWKTSRPSPGPPPTWMTPVYRDPSSEDPSDG